MPVVIHGAGPQLNKELASQGIESDYINGERVTTPQIFNVARRVFRQTHLDLIRSLNQVGTPARSVASNEVFQVAQKPQEYGLVGEIVNVDLNPIRECLDLGGMPILYSLGETEGGQMLNVNADIAAMKLSAAIQPLKVVIVNEGGGLRDNEGNLMNRIDFPETYNYLITQPWVKHGLGLKVREIKALLDVLPRDSSVSITSPSSLAKELFTHKGKGTLCRKQDAILCYKSLSEVDLPRLKALLETSFKRTLAPKFFENLAPIVSAVYLSESYDGVVIMTKPSDLDLDTEYLDKFAVTEVAQGNGVASRLWEQVNRVHKRLFWRSRKTNTINGWYGCISDGLIKMPSSDWNVYWHGPHTLQEIDSCVKFAGQIPESFTGDAVHQYDGLK
eukprot:c15521_g1_i1.p1 GENE.c15521_g1_i1~~c15521_g1_i1.p1  ORF type:complete len:389 (-),score=89.01 c15521_g1_i1:42-1208(-)